MCPWSSECGRVEERPAGAAESPRRYERRPKMKRFLFLFVLAAVTTGLFLGCSSVDEKPAVIVSDKDGVVEPRVVTVGYVNERMGRVPLEMIPEVPGDEGKREFMEEIIKKEILVIYGIKIGVLEDERLPGAMEHFENFKADEMLRQELIVGPAQVTPEEVRDYYDAREDEFQLQEIIVNSKEEAEEVRRRVTEGGEDFGRVAMEVSRGSTADDGGRLSVRKWMELHPLVREAVWHLEKDDVSEPFQVGDVWEVYKVISRKDPVAQRPLEGQHEMGISVEAKNYKRNLLEYYTFKEWMERANPVFADEALDICGTRIDEAVAALPEEDPDDFEAQMRIAKEPVVPQFTDEEAAMTLVTYNLAGEEKSMTLGEYAEMTAETPALETPRTGDPRAIENFVKRMIRDEMNQQYIRDKGYRDTQEMKDYLELRKEEFIIDITYEREVLQKVEEPMGQEIRDYYRSNLDKFIEPAGVDVQVLLVSTESQANRLKQRLEEGDLTFADAVQQFSIDDWFKARDGVIEKYRVGEKRLDFLQGVAFDLDIREISEPVRAPGGYALIRVLEKYPERQMSFDEVSDSVYQSVMATKREALLTALLDNARNSVDIDWQEENFQYIDDPVEVREARQAGEGQSQ